MVAQFAPALPSYADDFLGHSSADDGEDRGANDEISPEQKLWRGVVVRCWEDAFESSDVTLADTSHRMTPNMLTRAAAIRRDARLWLTSDLDPYASDRQTVCDLAGVDAVMLQKLARKKLESIRDGEKTNELDSELAELLAREAGMEPAEVDRELSALAGLEDA